MAGLALGLLLTFASVAAAQANRFSQGGGGGSADLPPSSVLIEITRNAQREVAALPSAEDRMVAVSQCYGRWGAAPSQTESAYCLQLDRAAYASENITAWATPGHFFSDWSFVRRQLDNAPPYDPALSGHLGQSRRLAAYESLADVYDHVASEMRTRTAPRVRANQVAEDIALSPETVRAITRRAVSDAAGTYSGFINWVAHASACYESLAQQDVEQRIYCLQFDATAMAMEQSAPESFRQMDSTTSDFYLPQRFIERQLLYLLPQEDLSDVEIRRRGARFVLNAAIEAAMLDWLAQSERDSQNAP